MQVAVLDGLDHPAHALEVVHDLHHAPFDGVGQRLDEVGTPEWVGDPCHTRLVGEHLLRAQGEGGRVLARDGERLVPRGREHRLDASEHGGQGLVGDSHDVVAGLRGVERRTSGDAADPEHARSVVRGAESLADDAGPSPPAGAVLRDLLEEVAVGVEEERDLRRELVDRQATPPDHLLAVRDSVHQGERHLLRSVGPGVTEVGARHGDGVEPGYLVGAELDRVGDEPERRARWPDPGAAAHVLLQDVVLDRAPQLRSVDTLLLADGDVEGEDDRCRPVDGEARADGVERDLTEEDLGVGQRVDGHSHPADLLLDVRVVGVVPTLCRKIEGDREPRGTLAEEVAITLVRLLGGAEAGVLADGPGSPAVPVGEVAPRERERPGRGDRLGQRKVGWAVAHRQGDPRLAVHRPVHAAIVEEMRLPRKEADQREI